MGPVCENRYHTVGAGRQSLRTNSVCPRPRWMMPATPAGIVSLGGVSVRSMSKWWCAVPDRSSLAGAISTSAAESTMRTSGPHTTAPSTGSTMSTRAGRSASVHAVAARSAHVTRTLPAVTTDRCAPACRTGRTRPRDLLRSPQAPAPRCRDVPACAPAGRP